MSEANQRLVKALHGFKGDNNDELCFSKGDIITVTQVEDGGWWEGTLNNVTGWFPSNYVKDLKPSSKAGSEKSLSVESSPLKQDSNSYRKIVYQEIIDTESLYVQELQSFFTNVLLPLKNAKILTDSEMSALVYNLETELLECHMTLVSNLEAIRDFNPKDQRIGSIFLHIAPKLSKLNLAYCGNHPKAASITSKKKEQLNLFMEEHGYTLLALTTGLSRPIRRLEKYPPLLQELQRHTEESHIDRGDTQRAISVYKELLTSCTKLRKQKEMELEIITGQIQGWEGDEVQSLGEILHMECMELRTFGEDHKKDCYLVLFPMYLVMLSPSAHMSSFIYEGKISLAEIKAHIDENVPNALEVSGPKLPTITAICPNQESLLNWHTLLTTDLTKPKPVVPPTPQIIKPLTVIEQPPLPPHQILPSTPSKTATLFSLKPHPPFRPANRGDKVLRRGSSRRKEKSISSKKWPQQQFQDEFILDDKAYEGDMKILQVIEAYCTCVKSRYTVNSASLLDNPQILIAEEEKIIIENAKGASILVEEKSLVDTVYSLKDQMNELKLLTTAMAHKLDEEKKFRKNLELLLKRHLFSGKEDILQSLYD